MTGRRLNTLLSVNTGFIITEAFSPHITPPERPLYPDRLCESGYQAINRRQSISAAATCLLMHTLSPHQTRGGSVRGSFSTSSLLSHTPLVSKNRLLSYLSAECQTHHLHGEDHLGCNLVLGQVCQSPSLLCIVFWICSNVYFTYLYNLYLTLQQVSTAPFPCNLFVC